MVKEKLALGTRAPFAPCDYGVKLGCTVSSCLITQECYYHFSHSLFLYNRTPTQWEMRFAENFPPKKERAATRSFPEFLYPNTKDCFRGKRDYQEKTKKWSRRYGWEIEPFNFIEYSRRKFVSILFTLWVRVSTETKKSPHCD